MLILGIETSCDDTSLAVVEDGSRVLALSTASQVMIHNRTGGVVPEIAAREHINSILPVLEHVLKEAAVSFDQIDQIAVTRGPGLVSSLLIGDLVASTLAMVSGKKIIPVHHIQGHIYGNWLERDHRDFHFPIMVLTVSGAHNELILMKDHLTFIPLGRTKDDAAGEAFDKVSRILGLGYPGGPAIAKMAEKGDPKAFKLPRAKMSGRYDFSFSGLKSEVLRIVEKELSASKELSEQFICDLSASFQECVIDVLSKKLFQAARDYQVSEVHIAGGVSANSSYRARIEQQGRELGFTTRSPVKTVYSTDNGAMIAACGYFLYRKNPGYYQHWQNVLPDPNLKFS